MNAYLNGTWEKKVETNKPARNESELKRRAVVNPSFLFGLLDFPFIYGSYLWDFSSLFFTVIQYFLFFTLFYWILLLCYFFRLHIIVVSNVGFSSFSYYYLSLLFFFFKTLQLFLCLRGMDIRVNGGRFFVFFLLFILLLCLWLFDLRKWI